MTCTHVVMSIYNDYYTDSMAYITCTRVVMYIYNDYYTDSMGCKYNMYSCSNVTRLMNIQFHVSTAIIMKHVYIVSIMSLMNRITILTLWHASIAI